MMLNFQDTEEEINFTSADQTAALGNCLVPSQEHDLHSNQ